jgi:hypothetical protein
MGLPYEMRETAPAETGLKLSNEKEWKDRQVAMWKDTLARTEATIQACGLMAAKRKEGVMVHSNLDDCVSAYFSDTCSLI